MILKLLDFCVNRRQTELIVYVLGFCVNKVYMQFEDTFSSVVPFYKFCSKLDINCDEEIDKIRKIMMTRKIICIIQRRKDILTSLRINTTNTKKNQGKYFKQLLFFFLCTCTVKFFVIQ